MGFGRKGFEPEDGAPSDEQVDDALAMLSEILGINVNFQMGYVFDPVLWEDPRIAEVIGYAGINPDTQLNRKGMLTDREVAAQLRADKDNPIRASLLASEVGLVPYDRGQPGGFSNGITDFHRNELLKIAAADASEEGKKYAVLNLFDWSIRLIEGEIEIDLPVLKPSGPSGAPAGARRMC